MQPVYSRGVAHNRHVTLTNDKETFMNKNIIEGKWEQLKGSAQVQWGKLTNDDLDQIEGNSQKLAGKIQEKYGYSKEEAEKSVEEWQNKNAA